MELYDSLQSLNKRYKLYKEVKLYDKIYERPLASFNKLLKFL